MLVIVLIIDLILCNYFEGGFIKCLFEDLWGNLYVLISLGELGVVDIFFNGLDGELGIDDDIGNWNINEYLN